MPFSRASIAGVMLSVLLCGPTFGQGTVRYVSTTGSDTGNDCADAAEPCATLGHAITQSLDGETIELSAGTFTEPPMAIDRDVTIRGNGTGATILQARESNSKTMVGLLGTPSGVTSRLEGLTIRHFEDLIRNEGDLSITDSEILDNTLSGCGCAVTNAETGTLRLERVRVSRNHGFGCGCGAVENFGSIEIIDSEISENGCDWEGPNGGGIRNLGEAVVRNTSIVRNDCQDGFGGGIDNRGTMTLEGSTVGENTTLHYSYGGILNTGDLSVLNSTISGNIAKNGWIGAIGNTGTLSIVSSTIVSNGADFTTGGISAEGTVSVKNSIIANNIDSTGVTDCAGSISSYGYNLISNAAGCTITEVENPGTDILGADPQLGPLADNGGNTRTHALISGSIGIDAGSCTDISGAPIEVDQRGELRDDGLCDIGSFERQDSSDGQQLEVYVDRGWNLISVPLLAADMSVETLFPDAESDAFAFDGRYQSVNPLQTAEGFWLKFPEAGTYPISGQVADPQDIPVSVGWNLIGTGHASIPTTSITSTPEGIVASDYFGFSGVYSSVENLVPGHGYWVKTTEAGTLHLGGSGKAGTSRANDDETGQWSQISFRDAEGRSATLLLAPEPQEQGGYGLPPLPPSGVFDVRFSGDKYATALASEAIVELRSAAYPVTILAQNLGASLVRVRDGIDGSLFDETLSEGAVLELTRPIDRLVLTAEGEEEVPERYALLQNYPNPFNPATTIGYEVPEAAEVRLVLYDLLGREVRVLVDARREAGRHQISLEASSLASGTYLYRLETSGFSDTRRLTVLR